MMRSIMNVIEYAKVIVKFTDGTKKEFSEDDVGNNFQDWLSDLNYDKNEKTYNE